MLAIYDELVQRSLHREEEWQLLELDSPLAGVEPAFTLRQALYRAESLTPTAAAIVFTSYPAIYYLPNLARSSATIDSSSLRKSGAGCVSTCPAGNWLGSQRPPESAGR